MSTTSQLLDVAWILVCAALVMLMQAGFSCLESGLVRTKNSINVAAKNFADFCVSSVVFWLFSFGLMFGVTSGGLIGTSGFIFGDTSNPWLMAFFIFQLGFCGTATTIVSGAVSERMRFAGYIVVATIISAVIYPVIGHWVWGSAAGASPGGWLEQIGFIDFAGSTVVHSVGGWMALASIIIIGPRIGRFGKNAVPIHGHDLPFVTLGVFLLWFGWFGFNGGSTLGLTPEVPTIIVNTTVSGAFGGVVAMGLSWRLGGRPDVTMIMNGSLAGLVGITASAHIMTPLAAAGIGSIAAVVMYAVTILLERLEIDDVVGAVPVHLAAGIWGTLAVAIFGDPASWGTGLSRWEQLGVQVTGVGATFAWAFGVGFALLWLINRWFPLRIDPEGERIGLNVAEHGASTEILDLLNEMDDQRRANDFSQPVSVEPHTEIGQIAQQYNRVLADINAEQRRREGVTEDLRLQTASLQVLRETAAAANRAKSIEDAIHTCLESICAFGGWSIGHCYMIDDAVRKRISAEIWHLEDQDRYVVFKKGIEETELISGVDLSGRVLASGKPAWIADVSKDTNFSAATVAKDAGIKSGAAFPVLVGDDVAAVLEFFSGEPKVSDEAVLEVMAAVGTQLGRVVERVRSETARFNSVIDNMPANVRLRDKDGRFILVNRNYENFYGVTNDSVRGKKLDELPENSALGHMAKEYAAADREVIEKNTVIEREYRVMSTDGYRTVTERTFPISDASGEVTTVGGVGLDITELKRTEEALQDARVQAEEAEARLMDAIENISDGFVLYDADERLVMSNNHWRNFYGYSDSDAAPGAKYEDLVRLDIERGVIADKGDARATYYDKRYGYRLEKTGSHDVELADGRILVIRERDTTGGGRVGIHRDITKRKRAERELAEKEAQLRLALDHMPGGMMLFDHELNYVLFNARYIDLFEYPDGLVRVGGSLYDAWHYRIDRGDFGPGDEDALIEQLVADFRDGEAASFVRSIAGSGRALQVDRASTPDGGYVDIVTDITERKRVEDELAEKSAMLEATMENMDQGITMVDSDLNTIALNRKFLELQEFPEERFGRGFTMEEAFRYIAERGEYGPGDIEEQVRERLELTRKFLPHRFERTRPNGTVLEIVGNPVEGGGFVTTYTDITKRKRAEEALAEKEAQLRLALDHMPGGMQLFDRDLNYVLFNARHSKLFEYPDGLVRVGGALRDALRYQAERGDFGPGDKDELIEQVIATYRKGEAVSYERTIAGTGRTLQIYRAPTPEGGFVNILTDITERKRAEEVLQEAYGIIKDQKERMEDELNIGREIQMSMIPLEFPPFPDHDEFSVFAALEPAREVGGDFYDYYFIDEERFCFCIGDVSGKGVPAALFMAMAKTLIKSRAADDRSAASILTHVNDELSADNTSSMFVTIFLAILNIRTGELVYTNAGHNPPYLKRKDGTLQQLDQRHGPVIGAVEGMVYKEDKETMAPGELIALFTDGVTEAMDEEDRLFSDARYAELLDGMDADDPESMVGKTIAAVEAFSGGAEQTDDITVLVLKFHGTPEDRLMAEQQFVIRNELPEINTVNEKFETFAEEFDIPRSVAMKFNVVFDELLSNVISYAYRDNEEHSIEIRMERVGKRLTVTITDDGVPFNPLNAEAPDTDLSVADREIGGMGIHLVRNLVDDVSYQRRIDKNVLTLISHFQPKDSAA